MNSADCINTQTTLGQNATPVEIIQAVKDVLGSIDLDPASDHTINQEIGARRFYDFFLDGYNRQWEASTVFLNPPGNSYIGGSYAIRLQYQNFELMHDKGLIGTSQLKAFRLKHNLKHISASNWFTKLWGSFMSSSIDAAIALVYRGGTLGSLPGEMLEMPLCITCSTPPLGKRSACINGSGRLSFDQIVKGQRVPQTSNTQSSAFVCLSFDEAIRQKFANRFSGFGVIKM